MYQAIDQYQHLAQEAQEKETALQGTIQRLNEETTANTAIIDYQEKRFKEQLSTASEQIYLLRSERDRAIANAAPAVHSTPSPLTSTDPAKAAVDPSTRTPAIATPAPSKSSRISERLPDPDKFSGDRKDLRRFTAQMYAKLTANCDRFETPISRMTYTMSRLSGDAYNLILLHTSFGVCTLPDYENILHKLDHAFGDPNRVNNARTELFCLRQSNKEFHVFIAEFQRLALEGEMNEDSLPTFLEQAISRELKSMLMNNEPASQEYHAFAKHLQDLDNRMRYYSNLSALKPIPPTFATVASKPARYETRPSTTARPATPPATQAVVTVPATRGDPMDLSSTRRRFANDDRKATGACFRCGSKEHRVAQCPEPDTRLHMASRLSSQHRSPTASPVRRTSPPCGRVESRSPSPTDSSKGVSLVTVAARR